MEAKPSTALRKLFDSQHKEEYDGQAYLAALDLAMTVHGGRVCLRWTQMYDAPDLSYKLLRSLAEFFETEKVDVDRISEGGCETCDYGSCYGHEIIIDGVSEANITKATEEPAHV